MFHSLASVPYPLPRRSGKPKRFCTRAVSSRIRRPFSPSTSRVLFSPGLGLNKKLLVTAVGPGSSDDDLSPDWRHAHFHSGIAVFSQRARKELVQLGVEHASESLCLQTGTGIVVHQKHTKTCIWQPRRHLLRTSSFWTLVIGSWQQGAMARVVPGLRIRAKMPCYRSGFLKSTPRSFSALLPSVLFSVLAAFSFLGYDLSARPTPPPKTHTHTHKQTQTNKQNHGKTAFRRFKASATENIRELQRLCKS